MTEISVAKTANRSVVGTMNEFAFLAEGYREYMGTTDLLVLSVGPAARSSTRVRHS